MPLTSTLPFMVKLPGTRLFALGGEHDVGQIDGDRVAGNASDRRRARSPAVTQTVVTDVHGGKLASELNGVTQREALPDHKGSEGADVYIYGKIGHHAETSTSLGLNSQIGDDRIVPQIVIEARSLAAITRSSRHIEGIETGRRHGSGQRSSAVVRGLGELQVADRAIRRGRRAEISGELIANRPSPRICPG